MDVTTNEEETSPKPKTSARRERIIEPTPDGHYLVIDGRKWRRTNPNLPEAERTRLVKELMDARRAVGAALRAKDTDAETAARARVNAAKVGLGERGPKWWEAGDADQATAASDPSASETSPEPGKTP